MLPAPMTTMTDPVKHALRLQAFREQQLSLDACVTCIGGDVGLPVQSDIIVCTGLWFGVSDMKPPIS